MNYPHVSIIIINWNGWKDTIECLESVYQIEYPTFDVIVVDNNSLDDSLDQIRAYSSGELKFDSDFFDYNAENKPLHVTEYMEGETPSDIKNLDLIILKNKRNYGFPRGNNVGIKFALENLDPDFILLLNNDTIVHPYFLTELVQEGHLNELVGILGPKIYYYDKKDVIWSAGCRISWKLARGIQIGSGELDHGQYDEKKEVEYVSGSAFLIKSEVIKEIGLMDDKYFLYFEESDWTLRANNAGFKSLYVPRAKIWHKISKSGGGISQPLGLYYITRNRWVFMKKWAKKSDYIFFVIYQVLGALILPILLSIAYKNKKLFLAYYRGLKDGIK
ncbi:glycosyltransferase family 2 protein [Methanobacterium sp. CWC-01]|uniref:glycosyltransferase family 2 protein n=1 Tax=Methanobacterium aridiramus TaxID=2584467 RepID=UPI002576D256|nr:glycosyltransferase family 2 protein [Methanobacterium sp. CWC-01]WJI10170.1 glycosyltransferase family 2 protein [Methanobacterium sp. CWC-01]